MLAKVKLGDYIELSEHKNFENRYTLDNLKGISIQKVFVDTKADMEGVSLSPYLIVRPGDFAFVPVTSRNGEKITIAHNDTVNTFIVSSSYIVFSVKQNDIILSDYLFMYFNRPEFDRYARFNSWGSARETFDWKDMCDIRFMLPPISIQQKYAHVFKALGSSEAFRHRLRDICPILIKGSLEETDV